MQHIQASSTIRRKNNEHCDAIEYEFTDEKDIGSAVIELTGRYPELGDAMNTVCKELIYVISGEGIATTKDGTVQLTTGDMILIQPNEQYHLDGDMKLLISSSPTWYLEQHVNL